jgi:hypothetical protein
MSSCYSTERPPDFLGPPLQYPHEAVGVGVVVDGGHGPLRPAHQDQVEVSVSCQQMAGQHATKKEREKKILYYLDKLKKHKIRKS